jgi:hypothetical protein
VRREATVSAIEPCHLVQVTSDTCEGLSVDFESLQCHIISHMLEKVRVLVPRRKYAPPPRALRAHTWSSPCPHPSSTWRLSRLLGCPLAAQVPFFKSLNKSLREEVSNLLDIEYHDRGGIV